MTTAKARLRRMLDTASPGSAQALLEAAYAFGLIADCGNCLKPAEVVTEPSAVQRLAAAFDDADEAPIELD